MVICCSRNAHVGETVRPPEAQYFKVKMVSCCARQKGKIKAPCTTTRQIEIKFPPEVQLKGDFNLERIWKGAELTM